MRNAKQIAWVFTFTASLWSVSGLWTSAAQAQDAEPELPKVRAVVRAAIEKGQIAGAVAYVARNARILHFEALGEADTNRPMSKGTLFRIASMTKPITSVAVMMLVEDGKLRLDDPVSRYIPEFDSVMVRDAGTGEVVAPHRAVTVRDLLTHTSGISYGFNASEALREKFEAAEVADGLSPRDPSLAENVKRIAGLPLAHQPGAAWTYGLNTDLLGRVIEVASSMPLERFFEQRIFEPLLMTDTAFYVSPDQRDRLAAIYKPAADGATKVVRVDRDPETAGPVTFSFGRVLARPQYLSGGAGLVASTANYARFLQMLLNEGQLDGVRVLKTETIRAMTTNQIGQFQCAYGIHGDKFGLGFGVTSKKSERRGEGAGATSIASVGSYSWGGIYHTFFWVDPRERIVAIVMAQLFPWGDSTLWADFQSAVYSELAAEGGNDATPNRATQNLQTDRQPSLRATGAERFIGASTASHSLHDAGFTAPEYQTRGRFLRLYWFEPGIEHGNPTTNRRFRVNDSQVAFHAVFRKRSEVRGNGMLQIELDEQPVGIDGPNVFEVLSDTTHHGIEVLLPGPELWVRTRASTIASTAAATQFTGPPDVIGGQETVLRKRDELRHAAMNQGGNAARGQILFNSEHLKCAVCHKVRGQGGDAGPDLSQVAGKLDRTHLIESVLDPSAQILEGYRTTVVALEDGRVLEGLVRDESRDGFTLIDAQNHKISITHAQVAERKSSPVSLMPADLPLPLAPDDFTHLIAYLETLRTGRKLTPGEGITGAVDVPAGFAVETIVTELTGCTAMEVAADGRVFLCEQTGALKVCKNGKMLDEPFLSIPVASTWERGLIGVTVAPDFPRTPYVYVCYVKDEPYTHHVISRWTADGDRADPNSEVVLFVGDDQSKLGGHKPDGHQGGALHFGADGKLFVAIGEQTAAAPSQSLHSLLGKILRLNPDGSIPSDNPFFGVTTGKYRAIWALGLRNPYTFAVQPGTGRMFINDVGGRAEEINEGIGGANFGWPVIEHGPSEDPRFRGPAHHYPTACISGGAFAPDNLSWPSEYRGAYYFGDFNHGTIRVIDPTNPSKSRPFANGLRRPVDLRFDSAGILYVLLRNAWVMDQHFQSGTGTLLAIRFRPSK